MTYYLVAVDTVGIQQYLFSSNRLRENIGASEMVAQATQDWVYAAVNGMKNNLEMPFDPLAAEFTDTEINTGGLDVEIIYAGGGNAVLIFKDANLAGQFITSVTEQAILEAPGLKLAIVQNPFEWKQPLSQIYVATMKALGGQKAARRPSVPLLGMSVTAACQSTGLPAIAIDPDDGRLIAAEIAAKLDKKVEAEKRLEDLFPKVKEQGYKFADNFNQLGTRGTASYIAVVHADGNSMSSRIKKIVEKYPDADQNRDFITTVRSFSQSLKSVATTSIRQVVQDYLLDKIDQNTNKIVFNEIEIKIEDAEDGKKILPIRPLVVGGDDLTFVCDGRLGLSLAALYLKEFNAQVIEDGLNKKSHACAGVAIVHSHYPFARAYSVSEGLCGEAKNYARLKKDITGEEDISALDWHFAINGLINNLRTIREQEYRVKQGNLSVRPVRLTQPEQDWVSAWHTFKTVTTTFQEKWKDKRNKLKSIRQALRDGPQATEQFLKAYDLKDQLPIIKEYTTDFQETGWSGEQCGYFDAIEAADYFVDLEAM